MAVERPAAVALLGVGATLEELFDERGRAVWS